MKKTLTIIFCTVLLLGTLCTPVTALSESPTLADTTETAGNTETATAGATETTTQDSGLTQTTLPQKAGYLFVNTAMGYGSGTLSMTMSSQNNATSFALYWGDSIGMPLEGYTPFLSGEITSPEMFVSPTEGFSIPEGAKTILLYTYSEQYGRSTTPYKMNIGDYKLPTTGKKLADLVIVSDLHIGSGKTADKNLVAMLTDVKNTAPDAKGIIVVGDAVEAADQTYYTQLDELCSKVPDAPPLYCGIGDRAYLTKDTYVYDETKHSANLQLFLTHLNHPFGVKPNKQYYSYTLGGTLMVFLGADSYRDGNAVYSQEQLTWLDGVLTGADALEPVFVFMHEPLPNTVSGSSGTQGGANIFNHDDVKNILKKYSNVVMFNGHTQWDLESEKTMAYIGGFARAFNTAGVAYLWSDTAGESAVEKAGSQGYYVTVYEDAVLIRGRDFSSGEWISNAIYMFSTKPTPVQSEQTTTPTKPSATTKPAEEETTDAEEEIGVRDLILPLCILAGMAIVVFIFIFRKPKDQP